MNKPERITDDTVALMRDIGENARAAAHVLAMAATEQKNAALLKRYEKYAAEYYDSFGR